MDTTDPKSNTNFKENAPKQEGIISKFYERLRKGYLQESPELQTQTDGQKMVQIFSQTSRFSQYITNTERKVLKGTHLPVTMKEIQAGYLSSPFFRNIYLSLPQNKLPPLISVIRRTETLTEEYLLLPSLLFRLNTKPHKEAANLARELCR